MSCAHNEHYKWVENTCNTKCSPLGKEVANILGFVGGGIYSAPINHEKTDWTDDRYIKVVWRGDFANYDGAKLTYLLIECFERMIRVEIRPHSFEYLSLNFWQRTTRDMSAHFYERIPTLEYMIQKQNEWYGREKK